MPNSLSHPNVRDRSRDLTERSDTSGNHNLLVVRRRMRIGENRSLRDFLLDRQVVHQIRQRLCVHQAMLDRNLQKRSIRNLPNGRARFLGRTQRLIQRRLARAGCIFPLGRCSANPRACPSAVRRQQGQSRTRKGCRIPGRAISRCSTGANKFQSNASKCPR